MPTNLDPSGAARRPRPVRHPTADVAVPPAPSPERDLRRMIGLSVDSSLEELRGAYDLAMHRATRAGDHQHALALSRAYDRLPIATRHQLYPSSRTAAGGSMPPRPPGRTWTSAGESPRRWRRAGRRRGFWPRVLLYGVVAPLAVGIGTYVGVHRYEARTSDTGPGPQPVVSPTAALQTAPRLAGSAPPVIVPADAPIGPNGLVTLLCRSASGAYLMTAPRGAVVECTNGAMPTVVG